MESVDNNTLYMYTNGLTEEEIISALAQGIQNYEEETGDTVHASIRLNLVYSGTVPQGYAWAWCSNSKLYHLLVGNNEDGTERIQLVEDEEWEPPDEPYIVCLEREWHQFREKTHVDPTSPTFYQSLKHIQEEVQRLYERPLVEKRMGPWIQVPYTEKDGELIKPSIHRGKLTSPEPSQFVSNQIRNTKHSFIPPWLTRDQLNDLFRPYVSNKSSYEYPQIRVLNDIKDNQHINTVFIEYEEGTNDAHVAMAMMKRIYLTSPTGEPFTMSFIYSQRSKKS